jgi:hypothetical protein
MVNGRWADALFRGATAYVGRDLHTGRLTQLRLLTLTIWRPVWSRSVATMVTPVGMELQRRLSRSSIRDADLWQRLNGYWPASYSHWAGNARTYRDDGGV